MKLDPGLGYKIEIYRDRFVMLPPMPETPPLNPLPELPSLQAMLMKGAKELAEKMNKTKKTEFRKGKEKEDRGREDCGKRRTYA